MKVEQEILDLRENLTILRADSLKIFALLIGTLGYVWLIWTLWPETGGKIPSLEAIVGVGSLTMVVGLSYALRSKLLPVASLMLVGSTLAGIACAVLAFRSFALAYLFILPVLFASVLLSQPAFLLITITVISLTLTLGARRFGMLPFSMDTMLPVTIIALAALASWLSRHNLQTALTWVWNGYECAHQNEEMLRQQAAELRRTLKALDEATYRLERVNYMLALARNRAEEARRLKQQFAQTISHELRTPLNLIAGFIELMAETPEYYGVHLSPAYLRDLSVVYRNAQHLQGLVSDVLDLARIEAAQMSILPEETDPAVLVQECLDTVHNLVASRGLTLHAEIEPDLPALWLDPVRIRQVLFNLINNAVRFTEEGGITVGVRRQEKKVVFVVADTGVGIMPEDIDRIFEEFQQADGSTRRRHGGAGLGLAISKRFVELHGGRIWVESVVGQGSTFYFSLPVGRIDLIEASGDRLTEAMMPMPTKAGEEPVLLVVTRSLSAATLLARYVHGCRTVVASHLKEAERAARDLMPQAVIVDRTCEEIGDRELEALARAWELSRVPFIACPLPGEEPLRQRLAVDGYLVKPISRQSVWDVMRRLGKDVDHVLVVDDDRDFVRLLSRMLEDSPVRRYRVTSAYSGQQALLKIEQCKPDLVLLDLGLPDLDGFQVIERMRSNPAWQHIPIVIVSAHEEIDYREVLGGTVTFTKASGLTPGEVIRWVQNAMDMAVTPLPAPAVPRGALASRRVSLETQ